MKLSLSNSIYPKQDNKRDNTPLMKRNISTKIIVTNAIPQTNLEAFKRKIKKRNNRTNSFGLYNKTESSIMKERSYLSIHKKPQQKKPLIVKMKQFTFSQIPFKNLKQKCQLTYSIDNKQLTSNSNIVINKDNILTTTSTTNYNNCINSCSVCFNSKHNLTYSDDSTLESQTTKKRIQLIEDDIVTLLQKGVYPQKKQLIIKELDLMFRKVTKTYLTSNEEINYSESIRERNKLKEENDSMKNENKHLQERIFLIETKFDSSLRENDKLKEYITETVDKVDKMNLIIMRLTKDIQVLQREKEKERDKEKELNNKSINESLDSINLISNQVNGISSIDNKPKAILDFHLLNKNVNFNDEFIENYKEFSPSWRKATDQMLHRQEKRKDK